MSDHAAPLIPSRILRRARVLVPLLLIAMASAACSDPVRADPESSPPPQPPEGEFETGSGIATQQLSPVQVENLALLGRVWGFAKYHHPAVTGGAHNWDFELFRAIPKVLAAPDRRTAADTLAAWLGRLGPLPECSPCAPDPADAHLLPDLRWTRDTGRLGEPLAAQLATIHRNRHRGGPQRYVSQPTMVGNPDFSGEEPYPALTSPDAGYRLLALFRFWNIVEYWFPYRDVIGEEWEGVLREFVPRLMAAEDGAQYRRELAQLIARVHDTHANLWSDLAVLPPAGRAVVPVDLRFVEGRAVVTGYLHATFGPQTGLKVGDVIEQIDGVAVDALVSAWSPFYAASNEPTRLRDIARNLTRGEGSARVTGYGAEGGFELTVERRSPAFLDPVPTWTNDLPGEPFQRLSEEVAYLKLSSAIGSAATEYVRRAEGARVLVIDIRNYPNAFFVFSLGQHLVRSGGAFAIFTTADLGNPGAFRWTPPVTLASAEPHFSGRVVILVDEMTQSSAEYHAMAFRTAPGALVVGSTTAGADGNVSRIPLPGGARTMISGIGVFYPNRTPTQRVGIVPDLVVRPTIAGIRAGRDEVLEAAVSAALGREFRLPPG